MKCKSCNNKATWFFDDNTQSASTEYLFDHYCDKHFPRDFYDVDYHTAYELKDGEHHCLSFGCSCYAKSQEVK